MEKKDYLERFVSKLTVKIQQSEDDWKDSRFASPIDSETYDEDSSDQQQYQVYLEKYRGKKGDIKPLGLLLYQTYMKNLLYLFMILTIVSLPRIILYYISGGLADFQRNTSFSQVVLQISLANLPHFRIDALTPEQLAKIQTYRNMTFASDILCVLIIFGFLMYWKILSTKISNDYMSKCPSPHFYCLQAKQVQDFTEEEIENHFSKFGKLAQISFVYEYKNLIFGMKKLVKLTHNLHTIPKIQEQKYENAKKLLQENYQQLAFQYLSQEKPKIKSCFICYQKIKFRNKVLNLYKYNILPERLLLKNQRIEVKQCCFEPLTINWQNYHVRRKSEIIKFLFQSVLLLVMIMVILIALFLLNINSTHIKQNPLENLPSSSEPSQHLLTHDKKIIYSFCATLTYETFKWEYYDLCSDYFSFEKNRFVLMLSFSLLVAVINLLTNRILWALVVFRRYRTLEQRNKFLITSIFMFSLINSAILILMVRGEFTGPILRNIIGTLFNFSSKVMQVTVYSQFNRQWYMNIGSQLIMNYIVSLIVFTNFHILLHWVRKKYRMLMEKKLRKPMKNPNFNYCTFYALSLKAIFFAMLYSNSMPIFYLLCFTALCIQIFVGRRLLANFVDQPVFVDNNAIEVAMSLIPYSLLLHCFTSVIFLNVDEFFPTEESYANINHSWLEGNLYKMKRGWVYILLSILIILFIVNQGRIYRMLVGYWLGRDQESFQRTLNKTFMEVAKNPAFLSSYRMKDNPKYKIIHAALTLFQQHMEEVKERMLKEDLPTDAPLRFPSQALDKESIQLGQDI